MPNVNDCIWNTLLGVEITDYTVHKSLLSIGVLVADNGVAEVTEGGVRGPERTENGRGGGGFSGLVDMLVGNFIDKANSLLALIRLINGIWYLRLYSQYV